MRGLAVKVDGLVAGYDAATVLHGITLDVAPGEIVALLGPSGCGKTTLLRCIAGLETPESGRIVIGGTDLTAGRGVPPERRNVGMVFQDGALFPHRTVRSNVGYGVARRSGREQRADDALRLVGLTDAADRMPGTLSGGEQQRVALARALAPEPGVMLLDEPFSSLDAGLRAQLRAEVRQLLKDIAVTAILVTHDQEEALTFGDRVAVMRAGAIEHLGSPAEVYRRPATPWVASFVGEANLMSAEIVPGDAVAATAVGAVPADVPISGPVTVLIRPEDLSVDVGGPATIVASSYFGRDTRYDVALATGELVAVRTSGPPSFDAGANVTVRFRGSSAHAWPTVS